VRSEPTAEEIADFAAAVVDDFLKAFIRPK
jgi:hypothetical protein